MIAGISPIAQALLGTLFTWGLTAIGAGIVFFIDPKNASSQKGVLTMSLGFAAGVMLAASYWSLLAPAVEMTKTSPIWGTHEIISLLPICGGFFLGCLFVYFADVVLESVTAGGNPVISLAVSKEKYGSFSSKNSYQGLFDSLEDGEFNNRKYSQWRRILLLIVAITIHNIPEGLAVGVGFGAIGKSSSATFESARTLALGIGIQNFPEGLAVSLPLLASGFSPFKSFWYGQLSGLVEPIAGVLGAFAVYLFEPLLPWSLSFAAGAMIYVVVSEIIPEARTNGQDKLANWSIITGFIIMMALDIGLG